MGQNSKIQWTDHTFNAWMGCAKAHTGCTNCYAERALPVAMRPGGRIEWGEVWQGGQRVVKADTAWREPVRWGLLATQKGVRRRVFCSSLADVLEVPELPKSWPRGWSPLQIEEATKRVQEARVHLEAARSRLWDLIRKTYEMCSECGAGRYQREGFNRQQLACHVRGHCWGGGLDWLLLTKRPEHWKMVPEDIRRMVWLGTSVSDQETANKWVQRLLQAEGFRYRFLSLEPMVGPVDLGRWFGDFDCHHCGQRFWGDGGPGQQVEFAPDPERPGDDRYACPYCQGEDLGTGDVGPVPADERVPSINWVIVGGESGAKARPCDVDWVRSIVRQGRKAGVPVFVKQLGAITRWDLDQPRPPSGHLKDKKGGDITEWPADLQVRQLPNDVAVAA